VLVAERDDERVHAVALAADDQLREHGGDPPVIGRVADVLLARAVGGSVDHEFLAARVIRRRRLQLLDVGAVRGLGHREAAGELERRGRLQVALVMGAGAQLLDGAAPQAELDPELDQQGEIAKGQRLK
jgi:hypothetical protein